MNKRLITSWLHVFMVIALFAIFYAAFEGISFYSGGNFRLAGIAAGVIVILLLLHIPPFLVEDFSRFYSGAVEVEGYLAVYI